VTAPPALRVVLEIEVTATPAEEFVAVWREMAAAAARAPGNLDQSLNVDTTDPTRWFIVSEWTGEDAFAAFSASPAHAGLAQALRARGRTVSMARMRPVAAGPVPAGDPR